MGLPIYHDQMYQNAPSITKYTNITQNPPKFVFENMKNIKSLHKKSTKSKKNIQICKYYSNPCSF